MRPYDPASVLATLEDLRFLDEHGVGATEAAARTGFPNAEALEKWLTRRHCVDLWKSLMHRDPPGAHHSSTRRRVRPRRRQVAA